ncbi:ribonuclease H-like domain-containing protein [Herpetosiphon geysericola]|uniref:YprB ribonuclease H-like domain-containing protein n=1 Tax=Herpetosiphon geysericola TaxID=70996 RepID=A0A0P6YAV6_9CHLR|nr:ribonuclease H-like domain-containing protein [Herpetosiphon geysericola]KPL88848.1 hypothetical protein SE18_09215 [Herpetosiphon geysericola]
MLNVSNDLRVFLETQASVGDDWLPPTKIRALYLNDPAAIWLEHHGAAHGFVPETLSYAFLDFLAEKGQQFEQAWLKRNAPEAVQVCDQPYEGREAQRVLQTLDLMQAGVPVIAQPALWWPAERIFGTPDLIVLSSWFRERYPEQAHLVGETEHYLVLDLKFSSNLDKREKAADLSCYSAQTRMYSYMLGQIQGIMPQHAFLITRDRLHNPIPIPIEVQLGQPLDADIRQNCERYVEIVQFGGQYVPWNDPIVQLNPNVSDERWSKARAQIRQRQPGGEMLRLWNIGPTAQQKLVNAGITTLLGLMNAASQSIPKGIMKFPDPMKAIMQANHTGVALRAPGIAPAAKQWEFFVDFEFFSNLNVDFEQQWPQLKGTPMIFMIGIGWLTDGQWHYRECIAEREDHAAEQAILAEFIAILQAQTNNQLDQAVLYHWHNAEPVECRHAAVRHQLPNDHILLNLPWFDLKNVLVNNACAVPGAWDYSLKSIAKALAVLDAQYDPAWPTDLADGAQAQLVGWYAYRQAEARTSAEMQLLSRYLEADCRATWKILAWLRADDGAH